MFQVLVAMLCLLVAAPAFSQSAYVAGAVGADVFRTTHVDAGNLGAQSGDGEAVAFSLGVGANITNRWGVDLTFTRPSEIKRDVRPFPIPLGVGVPADFRFENISAGSVSVSSALIPTFISSTHATRRNSTLDAVAFARQTVNGHVDLVYLGGITFARITETQTFDFSRFAAATAIFIPSPTKTITYGVGPVVGMRADITMTDHLMLTPGIRLHGLSTNGTGSWLLRPSVGLGWRF